MLTIRRILHPTDFSERSENAFRLACALARDHNAPLLVLHVQAPAVIYGEGMMAVPPPGYTESLRAQLEGVQAHDPRVVVEHKLVEGDPATEILRVARETGCDLIVLGTHGWTGLRKGEKSNRAKRLRSPGGHRQRDSEADADGAVVGRAPVPIGGAPGSSAYPASSPWPCRRPGT
jgi:nucleotide-binding universal stress UspA family protein